VISASSVRREVVLQETSSNLRSAEKIPSPFSPQDRIDHSIYGLGTIVEVNGRHTTIDFDEAGIKKFITSMVELSSSNTPAPEKPGKRKKKKSSK
jgi:hypothetical protein